jgi:hypothetical protein
MGFFNPAGRGVENDSAQEWQSAVNTTNKMGNKVYLFGCYVGSCGKLREASQMVLRSRCLFAALASAKAAPKASCLFGFIGLFFWKATKSLNKHPRSVRARLCFSFHYNHRLHSEQQPWGRGICDANLSGWKHGKNSPGKRI